MSDAEPATSATVLDDDVITVGSFDFPESVLLAEIYSQALEARGVRRRAGVRASALASSSVRRCGPGSSSSCPSTPGRRSASPASAPPRRAPTWGRRTTSSSGSSRTSSVVALASAPAQNANTFVVTRETAAAYDLDELSDLAAVAGQLTFGGPPECPTRPLCLVGLRRRYGSTFDDVVPLDVGGPATHQALAQRHRRRGAAVHHRPGARRLRRAHR